MRARAGEESAVHLPFTLRKPVTLYTYTSMLYTYETTVRANIMINVIKRIAKPWAGVSAVAAQPIPFRSPVLQPGQRQIRRAARHWQRLPTFDPHTGVRRTHEGTWRSQATGGRPPSRTTRQHGQQQHAPGAATRST